VKMLEEKRFFVVRRLLALEPYWPTPCFAIAARAVIGGSRKQPMSGLQFEDQDRNPQGMAGPHFLPLPSSRALPRPAIGYPNARFSLVPAWLTRIELQNGPDLSRCRT
jgi:hypothetical protein